MPQRIDIYVFRIGSALLLLGLSFELGKLVLSMWVISVLILILPFVFLLSAHEPPTNHLSRKSFCI